MEELLSNKNAKFVLSNRFSQDTLEIFFGQQLSGGYCNDNPSVSQFLQNAQALTVQKSLILSGSSNISSKKREDPLGVIIYLFPPSKVLPSKIYIRLLITPIK